MFNLIKYNLPATIVTPVKQMRYIKSSKFHYDKREKANATCLHDFDDLIFNDMQGKLIFCVNSGPTEDSLRISITTISLFDLDNKFLVHGLEETLSCIISDNEGQMNFKGKILITNKSVLSTGEIKLNVIHSHDNFFECNINIFDQSNQELVYGLTIVEQVKEPSPFDKAFAAIQES